MSDLFDLAADREAEMRADLIDEQQRLSGLAGKTVADSAHFCAVCEESIPPSRRAAYPGVQRCITCQEREERNRYRAR